MRRIRGVLIGAIALLLSSTALAGTAHAAAAPPPAAPYTSLSGSDPRDATASPSSLDFGSVAAYDTSAPKTVTLTGAGTEPITFGTASIIGPNPTYFKITSDGCSLKTLAVGQTCSITAVARPTVSGPSGAVISLPDDSVAGSTQVSLGVNGFDSDRGTYYPMSPYRVMDTRTGLGAPLGKVGAGGVVSLQVTGTGGVPADASTVVLNVTVTEPTSESYVAVYPTGVALPHVSSLNFGRGWTGANSVTVKVGANGKVDLYNAVGAVHIIADVYGYYTQGHECCSGYMGGQYHPLAQPVRLTDTRAWGIGRVPGDYYINSVASWNNTIDPHVRAFAVNVTVTEPTGIGYATAWNGSGSLPNTSTLNFGAGATVPNLAVVPTAPCSDCGSDTGLPSIGVYTTTSTHIIVDLVGFYDDGSLPNGLRFAPIVPTRIADTRIGQGWPSRIGPAETASIAPPNSVVDADTWALATNVTGVLPTRPTYLAVWPTGVGMPGTSNLNPAPGSVVPNAVQTMIGQDFKFNVFNGAGYCDVLVDLVGTFSQYPPSAPPGWGGSAASAASPRAARGTSASNTAPVTPTARSPKQVKKL